MRIFVIPEKKEEEKKDGKRKHGLRMNGGGEKTWKGEEKHLRTTCLSGEGEARLAGGGA